ncbi:hypothetical protein BJX70DRAFT_402735 [Aspergillus crustosus]
MDIDFEPDTESDSNETYASDSDTEFAGFDHYRIDLALMHPTQLPELVTEIRLPENQPYGVTTALCNIFKQIAAQGVEAAYPIFLPLFAEQWAYWEHIQRGARQRLGNSDERDTYEFPRTIAAAFDLALDAGHWGLAEALLREVLSEGYGTTTDDTAGKRHGSTRDMFMQEMVESAIQMGEVEVFGAIVGIEMKIQLLKDPLEAAVRFNRVDWLKMLISNLLAEKRLDALRVGALLSLLPTHATVLGALNQERAEVVGPLLQEALERWWENVIQVLLPVYVKFAASYPRSETCQAAHVLARVTDNMYHIIPRRDCLEWLQGDLPIQARRQILQRLQYADTGVPLDEVVMRAGDMEYRVARDVLKFHSRAFANINPNWWAHQHRIQFKEHVSSTAMQDVLRYMYSGDFVTSPEMWPPKVEGKDALAHINQVRVVAEYLRIDHLLAQCDFVLQEAQNRMEQG